MSQCRFISLFLVLCFLLCVSAAIAANWDLVYEANVLPNDKSLGGDAWTAGGKINFAKIVEDEGNKVVRITDPSPAGGDNCAFVRGPEIVKDVSIGTLESRVKSLSNSDGHGAMMGIEDKVVNSAALFFYPDRVEVWGGDSFKVDMTKYHVVRLTKKVKKVNVYVDGKHVIECNTMDREFGGWSPRILFGAGSSAGQGDSFRDYVAYTLSGAYSPNELPGPFAAVESACKLTTTWGSIKFNAHSPISENRIR